MVSAKPSLRFLTITKATATLIACASVVGITFLFRFPKLMRQIENLPEEFARAIEEDAIDSPPRCGN